MNKKIFYGSLIALLLGLLILIPTFYILVVGTEDDVEIVIRNCLNSGGTVVEYPEGKFERCIPR